MLNKIAAVIAALSAAPAMAEPLFVDRAPDLGLLLPYTGGWEYFVGGGVASFDCDQDLFPELFVAGGASDAVLLRNTTNMRAEAVSFTARTPDILRISGVTGAYPFDLDGDGILDLFVMRVGQNRLLKGGPDCTFSAFEHIGFDGGNRWTTAFSATWEGDNELPTFAVGNYVDREDPEGPFETCDRNYLFRPLDGRYKKAVIDPGHCPLSMLFSDWGRRGRQDLRISNDRHYYVRAGGEQLWAMENSPRLFAAADGWADISIWGMGIASRDISGDGIPEVFLTSMADQKLQMLDRSALGPSFVDATYDRGTTAHRPYIGDDGRPSTGWHVDFGDVDNDGLDDVFIAKGNVEQMPGAAMADPNNLLMQSEDGTFVEHGHTAGIASMGRSRGGALVDLNLDGRLDLVVVNRNAPIEIYQNGTAETGNWLLLDIGQSGTNSNAVGAWVEVSDGLKSWHREIMVGGGHASGQAAFVHIGVGSATDLKIRMTNPGGSVSTWLAIAPNGIYQVMLDGQKLLLEPL
jgi:hypothetical protein